MSGSIFHSGMLKGVIVQGKTLTGSIAAASKALEGTITAQAVLKAVISKPMIFQEEYEFLTNLEIEELIKNSL